MLTFGNQIKSARGLIGINQQQLSELAQLNKTTIQKMENKGPDILTNSLETVLIVTEAFRIAGVEFIDKGCRLRG